jgi:hypothetical protein
MRFGLKDVTELPSMEEFEKLVAESFQSDLIPVSEGSEGSPEVVPAEPFASAQADDQNDLAVAETSGKESDPAA